MEHIFLIQHLHVNFQKHLSVIEKTLCPLNLGHHLLGLWESPSDFWLLSVESWLFIISSVEHTFDYKISLKWIHNPAQHNFVYMYCINVFHFFSVQIDMSSGSCYRGCHPGTLSYGQVSTTHLMIRHLYMNSYLTRYQKTYSSDIYWKK